MHRVRFKAYGHPNIIGEHKTTVELTSESHLTRQGTCIIGVRAEMTLDRLDSEIKQLALAKTTKIVLRMSIDGLIEEVTGSGSPGLTYTDPTSMVTRTSSYESSRTLMIHADKAASDLNRDFVKKLNNNNAVIDCQLTFSTR